MDVKDLVKQVAIDCGVNEAQWTYHEANEAHAPLVVSVPRFKSRLALYAAERNLIGLLDIAKVADLVVFVMDHEEVVDAYGAALISALLAQGLPTVFGTIVGLEQVQPKLKNETKKKVEKSFAARFPTETKFFGIDRTSDADVSALVRYLCTITPRTYWRNNRTYMHPAGVHFTPGENGSEFGTLHLTGHVRGQSLDVNNLIHLTGIGDFQILSVDTANDPYYYDKRGPSAYSEKLTLEDRVTGTATETVALPNPEYQETLISTNAVDEMANEQTWPTEHDMLLAESLKARPKLLVPKGMSSYQARWLVPEDEEEVEDDEESDADDEHDGMEVTEEPEEDYEDEPEELEEIDDEQTRLIKQYEADAEEWRKRRQEANENNTRPNGDLEIGEDELEDDFQFPDEVDIPDGKLAQDAFRDYRGLQSFRTSPWDPYQNLPRDYGQIFRINDFAKTRKMLDKAVANLADGIPAGSYVTIHLKDVHQSVMEQLNPSAPLVASSLLMFENKFSVMHYAVNRSMHYEGVIKTGEELIMHVGFRRFTGSPLFTEDTRGSNKYKMEKQLHPDRPCLASVFAPITFPNQPVLMWKVDEHQVPHLAATGSVRTCDPNRIIVKKIILTGHPASIQQRKVVVSGMFYHPADVAYYKKAELVTKSGVRGHIREAFGDKGLMKCVFGDRITNADVVCLVLYKRVFPNWLNVPQPPRPEGTITVAPAESERHEEVDAMEEH